VYRMPRRFFALLGLSALLLAPSAAGDAGDSAPSITPVISGTLGANGWYTTNVTLNWVIDPMPLSSSGCDSKTLVADTPGTRFTCSATFSGGVEVTVSQTIKLDKTAPQVIGATPERPPDSSGWYNRSFTASFSGTDAMSGIQACSSASYSGPDSASASLAGSCWDAAGNVGRGAFPFKYDSTPPTISGVRTKPGNRIADIVWKPSPDARLAELMRSPGIKGADETVIYRGPEASYRDVGLRPGRKYRYTVVVYDEAANKASGSVDFRARGALLNPAPGARVRGAPLLVWTPVRGAAYYNVLLVRARKVYSAWPVRPRLQLPRSWLFRGQRYRLRPGLYRWYVWPGFGRLSASRFGPLLGGSTFVFTR
jgi:hypothetical protein